MLGVLRLISRYRFITNQKQLTEFISIAKEKPESLKQTIALVDSSLVVRGRSSTNLSRDFLYLVSRSRHLELCIILVANEDTQLDRRLGLQISHKTRLVSTEVIGSEVK